MRRWRGSVRGLSKSYTLTFVPASRVYLFAPIIKKLCRTTLSSSFVLVGSIGLALLVNQMLSGWFSALVYFPCFIFGIVLFYAKSDNKQLWVFFIFQVSIFVVKWCEWQGSIYKIVKACDLYLMSAVFVTLIIFSDQLEIKRTSIKKALDVLDEHSYTIYLAHGIVFCGIIDKFQFNTWVIALIAIVLTTVLTITIHKFFEKPIQKHLTEFSLRKLRK